MIFKIAACDRVNHEAYAERIDDYQILSDDTVLVFPLHGSCYFTDHDSIIHDPVIIRRCSSDWLYKIKLPEGE